MQKKKINIDLNALIKCVDEGFTLEEMANRFCCGTRTISQRISEIKASDNEILKSALELARTKQKRSDITRIDKKETREQVRIENALIEYNKELIKVLEKHKLPALKKQKRSKIEISDKTGIIHITDAHFNELVNLSNNRYDFSIASARLKTLVDKAKIYFDAVGVKNVLVAMTGDLMNSDRRLDELLAQASNRSKATFLSVAILRHVIDDIGKNYKVAVASVIGNESRMTKDVGWEENVASDNYDFTIYNILKILFEKRKDIRFLSNQDPSEQVVEVSDLESFQTRKTYDLSGQNVLLLHGNQLKSTSMEKSIQSIKGKYSSKGVVISFVLSGHLHCCRISDTFARGSSLVGANAYSEGALQLESRASQNVHVFYNNGNRDSIKIDLQDVDRNNAYDINKELESYNAKSASKAKKKVTIHRVCL